MNLGYYYLTCQTDKLRSFISSPSKIIYVRNVHFQYFSILRCCLFVHILLFFPPTHIVESSSKRGEWEGDFNASNTSTNLDVDPPTHWHPHEHPVVLISYMYKAFCNCIGAATFTHRSILSVPLGKSQLQLTHCQRRTAFQSNRFACHISSKKSNWIFPNKHFSTGTLKRDRTKKKSTWKQKNHKREKDKYWKAPSDGWK